MKTPVQDPSQNTVVSTARLNVALAFFAFIMIGANDGTLGVLLPSLGTYYHVDTVTISLIFLASTCGYFIASFNNGFLVEKLGNRRFLLLATTIFFCSVGILSLMPPFIIALGAALLLGMGIAMLDAGLNSYIASLPHNTRLLNYLHAFYGAGAWLGPVAASSILALQWGWNHVYWLWGGMSIFLLIGIVTLFQKQNISPEEASVENISQPKNNIFVTTLKLRIVWLAAIFLLFYVGTEVSLGSWSYSFLTVSRHGPPLFSGWIVSGYWLGLTLGRLAMGRLSQWMSDKRLIQVCLLGVIVGILLIWIAPSPIVSAIGIWIAGFSLGPIFPTTIALTSTLVSSRVLPGAVGFMASLGSMGGALFPWIAGTLAQHLGWWSLLPYIIILSCGMFCIWLLLQQHPASSRL
jgi:fucose permease